MFCLVVLRQCCAVAMVTESIEECYANLFTYSTGLIDLPHFSAEISPYGQFYHQSCTTHLNMHALKFKKSRFAW